MQINNNEPMPPLQLTEPSMEDLVDHINQLEALDWSEFPKFENKTRAQTRRILIELCWVRFLYEDNWS